MIAHPQVWVTELAARFWAEAGEPPFPRDLRAVLSCLPCIHARGVPHLTLATAAVHFSKHNIPCPEPTEDRALAGCFGGYCGIGVILFDSALSRDEELFTLAHETAHYLRDYDAPRRKVAARLGVRALEVLDGVRPATPDERLASVLRGARIGPHTHFLDRDRSGRVLTEEARAVEAAADQLAYELLAPAELLEGATDRAALAARLTAEFGLPTGAAKSYAHALLPTLPKLDSAIARLLNFRA